MSGHELAGAPLIWSWLLLATIALALPTIVRGFRRRGTAPTYERSFVVQRLPQLATAALFPAMMLSFEAIEFALGNGEPSFGRWIFEGFPETLPFFSLALVLPASLSAVLAWLGVVWTALGAALLIGGLHSLGASFSTDAEILEGQGLRTGGPYRFVLHPIYAGYVHFLLGSALTSLSPFGALLVLGIVFPLFRMRARYEETLLLDEFGSAYEAFVASRQAHRFVPLLPPAPR